MWAVVQATQQFWPTRANEWITLIGAAIGYTAVAIAFFWRIAITSIKEKQVEAGRDLSELKGKQALVERFMDSTTREVSLLHQGHGELRAEARAFRESVQEIQVMLARIETRLDVVGGIEEVVREVLVEARTERERGEIGPRRRKSGDEPR